MREIKFRAWLRNEKKFEYFYIGDWHKIMKIQEQENEVTQYVHLTDIHNKDIYEKDYLKHHDKGREGQITFVEDLQDFLEDKGLYEEEYGYKYDKLEIIGNHFENPKLLED